MATWLPAPVEKYDYGTTGGSWTRQPAVIVLHSTEGTGWTNYNGGSVAPHFTIEPKSGEIHQHVSLAYAARALAHPSGTPETNRAGAVQIEIIGTCDPARRGQSGWNFLPDMSDSQCEHIRALLDMISSACGIKLVESANFEPYPEPSYGGGYPRLSDSAWASVKGIVGHQHVPDNSHGDPGNIPIERILSGSTNDEGDFEMMGYVKTDDKSAQFLYTGTELVWLQDSDHRSRMLGEYKKQTGKDMLLTTISSRPPIERGLYGWLSDAAPDPTSAGVESGWDFSAHRVNRDHAPGSDVSADPAVQKARLDFQALLESEHDDGGDEEHSQDVP